MTSGSDVAEIVRRELGKIEDSALSGRIRELLVEPYPVERAWDYGALGERVTCWTVLEHPESNTGIAYAEKGFGPSDPWGLVFLSGDNTSVGMDCSWFVSLDSAMRGSLAWDGSNPPGYEVP